MAYSVPALMNHIAGNTNSLFISLTRSYGVAEMYARDYGRAFPTTRSPAYVYAIDLDRRSLPRGLTVIDPVVEVAAYVNNPLADPSYHHHGDMGFLLGIVNPVTMGSYLSRPAPQPKGNKSISHPPNISLPLQTVVRALRDAEIILCGTIPASNVVDRHPVV